MQVTYQSALNARGTRGSRLAAKLKRVLSRFGTGIANINVTLRGGKQKGADSMSSCQLQVELIGGGQVLVTGKGRRLSQAIRHSLKRAKHIVASEIKRRNLKTRQKNRQRVREQMRYGEALQIAS